MSEPVPATLSRNLLALLIAATLIGIVSRFVGLAHLPVWHDEAFTLVRVLGWSEPQWLTLFDGALRTPAEVLRFQQPDPALGWGATWLALTEHPEHAPLYYLLGRAAVNALPLDPVTALRGTAALFGALLPVAVWCLMRALFGRGPWAWIAAALVASSPLHLLYAQEARQYSLWLLVVVVATLLLVRALARGRRLDWVLYGASLAVGLWSHLLFVLVLPVHAAYGWLCAAQPPGRWWRPRDLPWRPWLAGVAVAMVLFIPWIVVFISGQRYAGYYTEWMRMAFGDLANLTAWGHHLVRAFVDLTPAPLPPTWMLGLLPALAVPLAVFLTRAPRPARWLPVLLALVYLGIVLGPDLLFGGGRSQHVRYALPTLLMLELMIAWGLAWGLGRDRRTRGQTQWAIAVLVLLGLVSQWRILGAGTWWSKQYSANNHRVAALINAADRPLVVVNGSGLPAGELWSLAYHLDPRVRVFGHLGTDPVTLPPGFGDLLLLLPNEPLLTAAGAGREIAPVPGTWQWFLARPVTDKPAPSVVP